MNYTMVILLMSMNFVIVDTSIVWLSIIFVVIPQIIAAHTTSIARCNNTDNITVKWLYWNVKCWQYNKHVRYTRLLMFTKLTVIHTVSIILLLMLYISMLPISAYLAFIPGLVIILCVIIVTIIITTNNIGRLVSMSKIWWYTLMILSVYLLVLYNQINTYDTATLYAGLDQKQILVACNMILVQVLTPIAIAIGIWLVYDEKVSRKNSFR